MGDEKFLRRVLVPVDGSASSLMAEETAAVVAKKTGATITALHVMQELRIGYRLPLKLQDKLLGNIEQHAKKVANDARALFTEEGVSVNTEIRSGSDPAEIILEFSEKDYDLVIMGGQGENETEPFTLGSVTKKVARHAMCPMLITKQMCALSHLLVGVDGSDHSSNAVSYAARLADEMASKITLINVQERRLVDLSRETVEEFGEKILSRALDIIANRGMEVHKRLELGVPSARLVTVAEEGDHDLIVLGSRGLGTVKRFLLGSVSDDVSNRAKCSVLIVPPKA